ncbi:MAG: hypothetical protein SGJ24_02925 [Chloroflexota bacterium]|nr:hypothetical protein [Chloroflexota bacterium]
MLEQVGNALTFLAFYTQSGEGKTGLTVSVDVRRGATTLVSAAAASEIGGGLYSYTLASGSVSSEGLYTAVFRTTDATVDQKHLPALWTVGAAGVEHLDADVSDAASAADPLLNPVPGGYPTGSAGAQLGRIGSAEVGVSAPVAASGKLTLYQGKDYAIADGTAPTWIVASPLDLTGATVTLDSAGLAFAASVSGSAGAWVIRVGLTAAQTAALALGVYAYELVATLISGRKAPPLVTGTLIVVAEV